MDAVRELENLKREVEQMRDQRSRLKGEIDQIKKDANTKDAKKDLAKMEKEYITLHKEVEDALVEYRKTYLGG